MDQLGESNSGAIAIVGMSGRWPGAKSPEAFWANLRSGIETISRYAEDELEFSLATSESKKHGQTFVGARGVLEDVDLFDAGFFGIYPREAELMDPQHRLFLECSWEALESAGCVPDRFPGLIGVYAGLSLNSYLLYNLSKDRRFIATFAAQFQTDNYQTLTGNDKDFLSTRVSYKLNLRGPSMSIQCACSTSLVAVSQACLALQGYQCDMALAGGVSISFPQKRNYLHTEEAMLSPDGKCRTFDSRAGGTVFGHGVGVVVLKRLSDAIQSRDPILAVIRGTAVNNDGSLKVGYAAPSVRAQAEVIAMAHAVAGVHPDSISYVEAHGTGTPLGDPIEVSALTKAFREGGATRRGYCALGTAKPYVGHLDSAAGVTGLIKTVLQLQHEQIPPLLHFEVPNPKIDFADSPFFPIAKAMDWKRGAAPRRAGVSAFGVGGTNAHLVVEEAPAPPSVGPSRRLQLLVLSARTEAALGQMAKNLAEHLEKNPNLPLADVAFTLQSGRRAFSHRRTLIVESVADAVQKLRNLDENSRSAPKSVEDGTSVVFLFPGQGSQYLNMGCELYRSEPLFRAEVDRCATLLQGSLGLDLREALMPPGDLPEGKRHALNETAIAQPAIFVVEYALARLWMSWGVTPALLIGHSIGEYVCAVIAGSMTLEQALEVVAARARLMQALPGGAMIAVRSGVDEIRTMLPERLSLAAVNSPSLCTVSGPLADIELFQRELERRRVASKLLPTSHAFHSWMMEPMMADYLEVLGQIKQQAPQIPWISTLTARLMTASDVADPSYWTRQLRQAVRFSEALAGLLNEPRHSFLEVGPGQGLGQLVRQHKDRSQEALVLPSLGASADDSDDLSVMLSSLGKLWVAGQSPDWGGFYSQEARSRVTLPTYPFERQRYWIEPVPVPAEGLVQRAECPSGEPPLLSAGADRLESLSRNLAASLISVKMDLVNQMPNTVSGNRKDRLLQELRTTIGDLSGIGATELTANVTFMELGLDSLFLTQASQTLQKKFGVKITFRELMEGLSSLEALAVYLDTKLPPEPASGGGAGSSPEASSMDVGSESAVSEPIRQLTATAVTGGASLGLSPLPGATLVERVLNQQMVIMQQQIDLLRGGQASPVSAPAGSPVRSDSPVAPASAPKPTGRAHAHGSDGDLKRFGPFKGIEVGPKGGLTPLQERTLAALTERYNRRTAGSKEYAQRHRAHFCDPRAAGNFRLQWKEMVYPIVCARSAAGKIWDIDGNEYVDVTLGFGANYFGHAPEFVVRALQDQIQKGFEIGPQSPLAGEAAEMLCKMTRSERATFCNTGSEAVMAAIRVARTVTGRETIVYFSGDYHGIFDEVLARVGLVDGSPGALPIAPGIPALPHVIVFEYDNPASLELIKARASDIAAVLVEPVQSRHPDLQPKRFLQELRKLTQESDIALIFDEVVTGFRVAPGGAQEYFGVEADLATYGKVIGGGMPIGVLAGKRRFMDALDGGMWSFGDNSYPEVGVTFFAGTFVRHPLVMAAAHATLKYLEQAGPDLQRRTTDRTARFVKRLNDYFASVEVPIRLQTFSSVFFYDFHPDLKSASLLFYCLRDRGVHIWEGRVGQICTAHTDADLEFVFQAFKSSVEELQAGGFFPIRRGQSDDRAAGIDPASNSAEASANRVSLTEAQKEIWIAAQMGADANCAYNESCSLKLIGALDVPTLQLALERFVERHDALRCRFSPNGDYQEFSPDWRPELRVRDLSSLLPAHRVQQAQAIVAEDMSTPFDLVRGPLIRLQLLKLGQEEHQLVLTTHHAVCDGWSFGVVFHELAQLYSELVQGKSIKISPAMQFREYATWAREQQSTPEARDAEAYWIRKFQGSSIPVLDLPYDRPRPSLKTYNGSLAVLRCDPQVFRDLKRVSGQMGNTVFGTLFAAFYVLLHRLSGQDDIVIGIPAAGQTMVGSNDLVGHCLNFLPTRNRLDPARPFSEFAAHIKSDVLDAYDHQNYTYGTLIQKLKLERDASRLPLLSVMFNIDKRGMDKLSFRDLKAEVVTNAKQFVNFDLFMNLIQGDHDLDFECEYNTDLFDHETVLRWLHHFQTLIVGIVADQKSLIRDLPLLDPRERQQLLLEWNQTQRAYPAGQTIHGLVEAQAIQTPDAVAAIFEDQSITYRELNRRANHLALKLQRLGLGPDKFVAVLMERNLDLVIGTLAILKAGAAYVPLDPLYPEERISFYLEDSRTPVLLTQRSLQSRLPAQAGSVEVVYLDDPLPETDLANPECKATDQHLAYVIYTSGSTGKPKGVAIEHRNAVNFIRWGLQTFSAEELSGVLASTSICFDLSIFELFVTLSAGGKVIIAENALQLPRISAREQVTLVNTVPSAIAELVQERALPNSVRIVNLAGEALPTSLVDRLYALGHVEKVNDLYGPTETTTYSTWTVREAGKPATIGRPVANTQIYLVDAAMQPTPIGVPGEMLIGGSGVARGYLNRSEMTGERFVRNPFSNDPEARVYRTGDLARYRADRNIEFLGRIDHQVKFRGFRIELGEIEAVLRTHPQVKDCVVVVREDSPGQKRLVGYVTRREAGSMEVAPGAGNVSSHLSGLLKAHAQPKLPDYMVPSAIVVLDALPTTLNGKVDRKALPPPSGALAMAANEFVAPSTEPEKTLASIWSQVLGVDRISVNDNFFEIGGDSLLSFRVANRATQAGLALTPRMFFQYKTIAELAKAASASGNEPARTSVPSISRVSRDAHRRKL
jgi:amino acid adenylation domain-containing protein